MYDERDACGHRRYTAAQIAAPDPSGLWRYSATPG